MNEDEGINKSKDPVCYIEERWNLKVLHTDSLNTDTISLYLFFEKEQFSLISYQYAKENKRSEFIEMFSGLMDKMIIDDYINCEIDYYKEILGEEYAFESYVLSQNIVSAYFNRFFT